MTERGLIEKAVDEAIRLHEALNEILDALADKSVLPAAIVPSAEGDIAVYFFAGPRTAYLQTYNDGSQVLVMYDHAGNTDVLEIGRELPASEVADRILGHLGAS